MRLRLQLQSQLELQRQLRLRLQSPVRDWTAVSGRAVLWRCVGPRDS